MHEPKKYLVLSTTLHLVPPSDNLIVGQIAHKEAGTVCLNSQPLQRLPSVQDVPLRSTQASISLLTLSSLSQPLAPEASTARPVSLNADLAESTLI